MIVFDRILNRDINVSEIEIPIIFGRYIFKSDELSLKKNDVDTYWVISKKDSNNADTFKRQF